MGQARRFKCSGLESGDVYDVVLFPTDGSEHADRALVHAIDLADRHDATLDVLHVAAEQTAELDGEAVVAAARADAEDAGLEVNTAVLEGSPHAVIVEYVHDRGVDAVVMGTHGRRGLDRFILGSVTEQLLRTVDVPVLVVPTHD